jgi:colanic acid biosynthesis protein WcaH
MSINLKCIETKGKIKPNEYIHLVARTQLVSVDLHVRNPDGEYLLGWRTNSPGKNSWFFIGCRVYKGEHVHEAVMRCLKEECGIEQDKLHSQPSFLGVSEHWYDENFLEIKGISTEYLSISFSVQLNCKPSLVLDEQHSNFIWLEKKALLEHPKVHSLVKGMLAFEK